MKFAHRYQETLSREDFPAPWVQCAISYGRLKKCIKKVQQELLSLGLDTQTLRDLLEPEDAAQRARLSGDTKRPVAQYYLEGDAYSVRPCLCFLVDSRDGQFLDVALSQETREYLRRIALRRAELKPESGILGRRSSESTNRTDVTTATPKSLGFPDKDTSSESDSDGHNIPDDNFVKRIEVPLASDNEFFDLLKGDMSGLDDLQEHEQAQMTKQVMEIGATVSHASVPSKSSETDMARWRQIFELYVRGEIFFSTSERNHGPRNAVEATKQFEWFSEELVKRGLDGKFNKKESPSALDKFLRLNVHLLRHLKFQEINQTAMFKILKKFDKRTALGVQKKFPELVAGEPFLAQTVAKAVCFKLAEDVLSRVPHLNDYLCPVCFNIAYKPVRLRCGHIFCICCLIVMQRARSKYCPLCRGQVVMEANISNLDSAMMNFLKQYFPKEVKAKQIENQKTLTGDETVGDHNKCAVM